MNIKYKDITLRAIEAEDMPLLKEMMNDPEIERMTGGYSFPLSDKNQKDWFENLKNDQKTLRTIIDTTDYGAVGVVMLSDIDWKNRTAEFHSKIASSKNIRGKGIGTKATTAIIKYAFEQLGLQCIYSNILEDNKASQRVKEKCGFKMDGVLRNRVYKNNKINNVTVWSVIKGELIEK